MADVRSRPITPAPTGSSHPLPKPSHPIEPPAWDRAFIIHEDEALIVVDKPPGLPSVPGKAPGLQDCAASRVQQRHADARVVHRLDMATSGLLLFARGLEAQRHVGRQFEGREVEKIYVAVVSGVLRDEEGLIDLPLRTDWPNRPRQKVDATDGKPALTRWRVLGREGDRSRLELRPLTGRSHQLRVHLLSIGHPIVGDDLYAPPAVASSSPRLLLHACRLTLRHPRSQAHMTWHSAPAF